MASQSLSSQMATYLKAFTTMEKVVAWDTSCSLTVTPILEPLSRESKTVKGLSTGSAIVRSTWANGKEDYLTVQEFISAKIDMKGISSMGSNLALGRKLSLMEISM